MPHMYDHLWCPNGQEVDWKCPSVRPYVCPSQTLPLYLIDEPYARDLQAQGACALRFFYKILNQWPTLLKKTLRHLEDASFLRKLYTSEYCPWHY